MSCLVPTALYSLVNMFLLCHFCWCELSLDPLAPGASNKLGWIIFKSKAVKDCGRHSPAGAGWKYFLCASQQSEFLRVTNLPWQLAWFQRSGKGEVRIVPPIERPPAPHTRQLCLIQQTPPVTLHHPGCRHTVKQMHFYLCWWYHAKADYTWLKTNLLPIAWSRNWWFDLIWQVASTETEWFHI